MEKEQVNSDAEAAEMDISWLFEGKEIREEDESTFQEQVYKIPIFVSFEKAATETFLFLKPPTPGPYNYRLEMCIRRLSKHAYPPTASTVNSPGDALAEFQFYAARQAEVKEGEPLETDIQVILPHGTVGFLYPGCVPFTNPGIISSGSYADISMGIVNYQGSYTVKRGYPIARLIVKGMMICKDCLTCNKK